MARYDPLISNRMIFDDDLLNMVISSCEAWMAEGNPKTDPWTGERRSQLRRSRERRSWSRKSRSRERRSRSRKRRSRSRERRSRCGAEFETKTQHEGMKKVEWIKSEQMWLSRCCWNFLVCFLSNISGYLNLFVASIVAVQSHSSSLGERPQKRWERLQICSRAKSRPWPEWRLRTPVSCYVSEWYWIAFCSANRWNPMTSASPLGQVSSGWIRYCWIIWSFWMAQNPKYGMYQIWYDPHYIHVTPVTLHVLHMCHVCICI